MEKGMTNEQFKAWMEAIKIISEDSKDKNEFAAKMQRITEAMKKGAAEKSSSTGNEEE